MKRWLLIALSLLMILSLVACDGEPKTSSDSDTDIPVDSTPMPDETTPMPDETSSEPEASDTTEPESSETTGAAEIPADPTEFVEAKETVYVYGTDVLNIRKSASTDGEKVGEMKEGESVTRTGYSEEWSRISYYGEIRYAASRYLTTVAPFEYTNKTETVYVNGPQLNLRVKASPEADIVVTLNRGDAVERTGVSTTTDENGYEWSRLLYNGQVCYANSSYLSATPSVSDTLSFAEKSDTVYTTAEDAVNLREDASATAAIVASVGYGTHLERTGLASVEDAEGIVWSRVVYDGKTCYISTAYLTTTPLVSIEEADETVYITTDSLNVRSIPSLEGSVLKSLPKGSELHCIGKATEADGEGIIWYKVEHDGTVGYASARYLSAQAPES